MRSWDKYCEDTEKAFKHYTDCMCDDDEEDTQEAQDNELADKYNAITAGFIITSSEPKETRIPHKLFI